MNETESIHRVARVMTAVSELFWFYEGESFREWASLDLDDFKLAEQIAPHGPLVEVFTQILSMWHKSTPEVVDTTAVENDVQRLCDWCNGASASIYLTAAEMWFCGDCYVDNHEFFEEDDDNDAAPSTLPLLPPGTEDTGVVDDDDTGCDRPAEDPEPQRCRVRSWGSFTRGGTEVEVGA